LDESYDAGWGFMQGFRDDFNQAYAIDTYNQGLIWKGITDDWDAFTGWFTS
jgi:hypothetical protein